MKHLSALLTARYRAPKGGMISVAADLGRSEPQTTALKRGFRRGRNGATHPPMWEDAIAAVLNPHAWDPSLGRDEVFVAFCKDAFGEQPPEFWRELEAAFRELS